MPLGLLSFSRLYVVNDGDQSVPIVPDVEYHIIIHIISILEDASHFFKCAPSGSFHNLLPCLEFIRRILVGCCRFLQMLSCDNLHSLIILHKM